MLKKKYQKMIKNIAQKRLDPNTGIFIYGSSVRSQIFDDVDIGFIDPNKDYSEKIISKLKDDFEESLLPYEVDVTDFNKVDPEFRKRVFNEKILWLTSEKKLTS